MYAFSAPIHALADDAVLPNVNAFQPVKPSDYSVMEGAWYAFATPEGLTCVLDRRNGGYGCSGAIPAAPRGANIVSAGPTGPPDFASGDRPLYGDIGQPVKALPTNSRLSVGTISCGTDGVATSCVNTRDQTGFVISPAGSFVIRR
nr:hypothetical protein [Mycobacterium sp. JS623]